MNDITSTSLSMEKELKKYQAKENSKKLNDLKEWFLSFKTELLNMELNGTNKIETIEVTENIKREFEKYIDNALQNKLRSCEIYKKRIGLIDTDRNTLECIAEPYGITRERVRQILLKAYRRVVCSRSYFKIEFLEKIKNIIEENDNKKIYKIFVMDFIDLYDIKFAEDITTCIFGSGAFKDFVAKNNNCIEQQKEIETTNKIIEKQEKFKKSILFPGEEKKYFSTITTKPPLRETFARNGGKIFLSKARKEIQYQSKMELDVLNFLESHPLVLEINTQCINIPYFYANQSREYYPNLVIKTIYDTICIIDVMLFFEMPMYKNLCKFKALHEFCEKNGMGYAIIDEKINSFFDYYKRSYDLEKARILINSLKERTQLNRYEYSNLLKNHNITIKRMDFATIVFHENLVWMVTPFKLSLGDGPIFDQETIQSIQKENLTEEPYMTYFNDNKTNELALKIRNFAEEQAKIENVPFWKVVRNKSIISICLKKPISIEEFEAKKVLFGKEKVSKYGLQIIEIIRAHYEQEWSPKQTDTLNSQLEYPYEEKKKQFSYSEKLNNYINILQALNNDVNIITGELVTGLNDDLKSQLSEMIKFFDKKSKGIEHLETQCPNQGKPWTLEENEQLLSEYENGKSISEICEIHGRSYGSIRSRLLKLGVLS